jgi:hypothetical protein
MLAIFIPSKGTLYKMWFASYATLDNYEKAKAEGKEFVDYIIDKIKEAKSDNASDGEVENEQ